jgi:surface antigen
MRRFFLAALFAASLVTTFAIPQAALASGQKSAAGASGRSSIPAEARRSRQMSLQPEVHLSGQTIYPNRYPWGQCTWWAAQTKLTENLEGLGDAQMWFYNAWRRGLHVGYLPAVGATVVFGPGWQGAGPRGHVGHVVAAYGLWFELSEMNFYGGWPPGGFGRVDYRWATAGAGVAFIY